MPKFDFGELKKKASAAAEKIAEKSMELAKTTAEKTKQLSMIAKLNADILSEKDNIKKAQQQLGKTYYELFRDRPNDELAEFCIRIDAANEAILNKQEQIKQLKAELAASGQPVPEDAEAEEAETVTVKIEVETEEPTDPSPDDFRKRQM
jgi:ATP-dependent protease HslVU (ClpYQ) peptidase subunit